MKTIKRYATSVEAKNTCLVNAERSQNPKKMSIFHLLTALFVDKKAIFLEIVKKMKKDFMPKTVKDVLSVDL